MVILLSVIIEPLVEIANVMREKIIIGTALTNSCRAAHDRSLAYSKRRDADAETDSENFKYYFSEAFEAAMNVTRVPTIGDTLSFTSNDDKYNKFTVSLNIANITDSYTDRSITKVNVKAESIYRFKTKFLKLATDTSRIDYNLTSERMLLLRVRN